MSYQVPIWTAQVRQRYNAAATAVGRAADWTSIIAAVTLDTRTHDKTIQAAPAGLTIGLPLSPFKSEINLLINRGLAGNLTGAQMAAAMTSISA